MSIENNCVPISCIEPKTPGYNQLMNVVYNPIKNILLLSLNFLSDSVHSFYKYFTRKEHNKNKEQDNLHLFPPNNRPPSALCLTRARSIHNGRFNSSLGPLIRLSGQEEPFSFALLYCAHTANYMKGNKLSFTRLHRVDSLTATKYHSFPEKEFNDLAIAHTRLTKEFCNSQITRSKIKPITSANIGEEIRIITINNSSHEVRGKIKAVDDHEADEMQNDPYANLVQLDVQGFAGDSGSPVLSIENEVIGIIVRTDIDGFSYCNKLFDAKVPIFNLYERLNRKIDLNEIYLITQ